MCDLVPRQVDVSAFGSSSADKLTVGLREVWPEGPALVPVDAEVQDAKTHTHTHLFRERLNTHIFMPLVTMREDQKITWGRLGTDTGHPGRDARPSPLSTLWHTHTEKRCDDCESRKSGLHDHLHPH